MGIDIGRPCIVTPVFSELRYVSGDGEGGNLTNAHKPAMNPNVV